MPRRRPDVASTSAVASPMPEAAPVTRAIRPVISAMLIPQPVDLVDETPLESPTPVGSRGPAWPRSGRTVPGCPIPAAGRARCRSDCPGRCFSSSRAVSATVTWRPPETLYTGCVKRGRRRRQPRGGRHILDVDELERMITARVQSESLTAQSGADHVTEQARHPQSRAVHLGDPQRDDLHVVERVVDRAEQFTRDLGDPVRSRRCGLDVLARPRRRSAPCRPRIPKRSSRSGAHRWRARLHTPRACPRRSP